MNVDSQGSTAVDDDRYLHSEKIGAEKVIYFPNAYAFIFEIRSH